MILNPFDARSAKWNLFAELKNAYDVDELRTDALHGGYGQAKALGVTDVGELYRLLMAPPKDELQALVAGTLATPFVAG